MQSPASATTQIQISLPSDALGVHWMMQRNLSRRRQTIGHTAGAHKQTDTSIAKRWRGGTCSQSGTAWSAEAFTILGAVQSLLKIFSRSSSCSAHTASADTQHQPTHSTSRHTAPAPAAQILQPFDANKCTNKSQRKSVKVGQQRLQHASHLCLGECAHVVAPQCVDQLVHIGHAPVLPTLPPTHSFKHDSGQMESNQSAIASV